MQKTHITMDNATFTSMISNDLHILDDIQSRLLKSPESRNWIIIKTMANQPDSQI